ncbi:hypothetical protein N7492_000647 [Penicillium capsulatum]|uniref:Zn(2)-C6 fungal-type domain-containing protein n=1 Tax=Penicillium capsulatum TaxID=69766 RepID=A0A9W9IW98_9EURO|nr:hypothetical protein N7492_000647 [Penicillium capsulatum]KAJ6130294.1 hypothetical protein N7512_003074 [Penicillium capsulatum]
MAKPNQRHACDRCHGQKLRCIHSGSGPCVRCAKAKTTCSWSQSLRSTQFKKPKTPTSGVTSFACTEHPNLPNDLCTPLLSAYMNQPSGSIDLDPNLLQTPFVEGTSTPWTLPAARYPSPASQEVGTHNVAQSESDLPTADWMWPSVTDGPIQSTPPANWQQTFNQEWGIMESQQSVPTVNTPSQSLQTSDALDAPKTVCLLTTIRALSELNVELYAHETSVPNPPASIEEPISWKNKDFAIDRTFHLSHRLIEIVNKRHPRFLETARMQTPEMSPGSSLENTPPEPPIDQGSCLLIMSCYTRLIETYDRIFANMQGCLDRSSVTAREDYVSMPSVQVGSFSLPESSSLQIVLILQLARQLLSRIGKVIKAVQSGTRTGSPDTTTPDSPTGSLLLSSALETVSVEEERLLTRITKLRSTLIDLNIL